jgi:hypothetical protein
MSLGELNVIILLSIVASAVLSEIFYPPKEK